MLICPRVEESGRRVRTASAGHITHPLPNPEVRSLLGTAQLFLATTTATLHTAKATANGTFLTYKTACAAREYPSSSPGVSGSTRAAVSVRTIIPHDVHADGTREWTGTPAS